MRQISKEYSRSLSLGVNWSQHYSSNCKCYSRQKIEQFGGVLTKWNPQGNKPLSYPLGFNFVKTPPNHAIFAVYLYDQLPSSILVLKFAMLTKVYIVNLQTVIICVHFHILSRNHFISSESVQIYSHINMNTSVCYRIVSRIVLPLV